MEDHNRRVFRVSDARGTCFQLYFSVSRGEEGVQAESNKIVALSGNSQHILAVDNEPQL